MSDIAVPPKNPAVLARLKKRLEHYRKHHDETLPRYETTTNGINEDQKQQTALLRQRYEQANRAKKSQKKDKNKQESNLNVITVPLSFLEFFYNIGNDSN